MHRIRAAFTCLALLVSAPVGVAAELVMFEKQGCPWCAAFNREIGPIYSRTKEGRRAPLRRVDIGDPLPSDLRFIKMERFTPVFVLIDQGQEIGRIRGYPGDNHFWGLLSGLMMKVPDGTPTSETKPSVPATAVR